ncbi:cupin domain-containing protein [Halobacillus sp. BBL2006]|uniref:cupin domain-containing protein n=1 Tax=Halobacillus sp. BBL2006 TaxID=1543706 RepID=UPI000543D416|nr:cupin domain-containing protein [Halobacillus sp. BBL2006]KHE69710.1 cupin [Halobacillus sp. BBL2006]
MTVQRIEEFQKFDEKRMTKQMVFEEEKSKAFVLNFMPGQKLPSHGHPYTQVYLLVLNGTGECKIDEKVYEIKKGDTIHCSKEEMLSLENTGEERMSVYVVLAREPKTK